MIIPLPSSSSPNLTAAIDVSHWRQHYRDHLQDRLAWATTYVLKQPLSQTERHVRSFLSLLQQARIFRELDELAVTLIAALHPWPQRWGEWELWESELRFAVQAYKLLGRPILQAEYLTHLAERLTLKGHLEEAKDVAQQALTLAQACRSVVPLSRAGVALISVYDLQAEYETSEVLLQSLESGLEALRPHAPKQEFVLAQTYLGLPRSTVLRKQGQILQAIQLMDHLIANLETLRPSEPYLLGELYRTRGLMHWVYVQYPEAKRDLHKAMTLFAQEGDAYAEAYTQSILGLVHWSLSELDEAERTFRRSIAYDEQANARWRLTRDVGNLALVYLSRGELEETLVLLERHEQLALQLNDTWELHRVRGHRAEVQLCQRQAQEAREVLQETYDYGQKYGSREGFGLDCLALGLCHVQLGNRSQALQLYEEALTLSRQINSPALETLALRYLASEVDVERGRTYLQRALTLAQTCGRRLDVAFCLLTLASIAESPETRAQYWELGVQELEAIGATAWLKLATPESLPCLPPLL